MNPSKKKQEFLYAKSSLLGIETGSEFIADTIQIEKGDRLLLYTDGITEAVNKDKEYFGREKFVKVVNTCASQNPKEVIDTIMNELNAFREEVPFNDDVTLMVLGF